MAKLLPVILILTGLAGGVGAGLFLRPPPETAEACVPAGETGCPETEAAKEAPKEGHATVEYVKLDRQFVVPVVRDGRVAALVVMSLSVELPPALAETVYDKEPKLRDALLRVMFLHSNSGGFEGQFTSSEAMKDLRGSLREAAQEVLGKEVSDVLVTDILRQDV